ncbi:MAG: FAD:protein FMN transferase [Bacteroidota bacterium]
MKKVLIFFLWSIVVGCAFNPWVKNLNSGNALGTTYSITYISDQTLDFQTEIDSVFQAVNQSMSTYIPNSDISKINQGDSTMVIDHMFEDVFKLSKEVFEKTEGYFDPTVGVLVNAWGFGPGKQMDLDSTKIDSLLRYVGFEKVGLNHDGTISKTEKRIYFDFNAIAKGYAIDCVGELLNSKGITNYLVEVGGEVLAKGSNVISEKKWTVGIDDPQVEVGRQLKLIVTMKDKALASSGNYRKFRIDSVSGQRYVHTIDPKTGFTKNGNVLATSVVADNCATADAYATAFMAMDLKDSIKLLVTQKQLEAYIIYLDKNGDTKEFMTSGFKTLVQ